jgi:hypothetical protein
MRNCAAARVKRTMPPPERAVVVALLSAMSAFLSSAG